MTSPAKRHFLRAAARSASAAAAASRQPLADANAYELMLAQLDTDRRRLKTLQSLEKKIELKRELLPAYTPWVEGVLQADSGVQDDVLMTVLVWRIDVLDWAGALPLAAYALAHRLLLPDQYHRTLGCLLAEEFADGALKALRRGEAVEAEALAKIDALTENEDMPDEVRAKLGKALGLALEASAPDQALAALQRALALHEGAGVKKDIERIERTLKQRAAEAQASPSPDRA